MATLTVAWIAPIVAFSARNAERPPTGASLVVFAVLGSAAALVMFAAPERLFRLRSWERAGTLYRRLGVRRFRRIVPYGDLLGPGTKIQRVTDAAMQTGAMLRGGAG